MDITFVPIPRWDGATGNWNSGRAYYNRNNPKYGQQAQLTTIVLHWFGELRPSQADVDSQFRNASGVRSAHFSVQDGSVHQYVNLLDTAYHAGVGTVNCESIGIEHAAGPGSDATDATYEGSSQLVAWIARKLGRAVSSFQFEHHFDVYNTECSGTLDLGRVVARALAIEAGPVLASVQVPVHWPDSFAPFLTDLEPSQSYSDEVKRVQEYLVARGFMADQGQNDGYYGPITQAAVNGFQKAHGIQASPGYFGWWYPRTRAAANADLTNKPATNA
jgi:hypothetical protein